VLVALSGGRDSVALLDALCRLRGEFSYDLAAGHVHHGLSPHADEWEAFCRTLCSAAGIPLTVYRVRVAPDSEQGLEAAARAVRYQALMTSGAKWLACAHQRGDQAETLLFNLLRGAGVRGAAAMQEVRPLSASMALIRPLLPISRPAIEAYLSRRRLDWIDDHSNLDLGFRRNFLRQQVLPLIASRFAAAEERLAASARRFGEARMLLDELALADLAGEEPCFPLPLRRLMMLSEARGRNLLHFLLSRHGVPVSSELRLAEALRQFKTARPDRHPSIAFGPHRLVRRRGKVHLEPSLPPP